MPANDVIAGYRIETDAPDWTGSWTATQVSLDRRVDLAVASSDVPAADDLLATAEILADIHHVGLARVLESGRDGNQVFRASQPLDGTPLRDAMVGRSSTLSILDSLEPVAEALDLLHERGVAHGAVSPDTIRLTEAGSARLAAPPWPTTDAGTDTRTSTPTAVLVDAPERFTGAEPSAASDNYSFAATVFEVLAGRPPFVVVEDAIAHARGEGDPPSASTLRPELPAGVDAPLKRALASDPSARPDSAVALLEQVAAPLRDHADQASRTRRRIRTAALSVVGLSAVGLLLVFSLGDDKPSLPEGAIALGSTLGVADGDFATVTCDGESDLALSRPCSMLQMSLDDATLTAFEDGSIRGWAIEGAIGVFQIQVLRPRDGGFFQVFTGQIRDVPDTGRHEFTENVAILEGDVVGLILHEGGVGVRADAAGATAARWVPPRGGGSPSAPELGVGSGFDHELLFQAIYLPGVPAPEPAQLNGQAAAEAPDGVVLEERQISISETNQPVLQIVLLDDRIVLDLVLDGTRIARIDHPTADPAGELVYFDAYPYGDDVNAGVDVEWLNPSDTRPYYHYYEVKDRVWDFAS